MLKPILQARSRSLSRDAQAPVGAGEPIANFDLSGCVEEIETTPAQQPGVIFKPDGPMSEAMRLPTVEVFSQCSQSLLPGGRHTGDEPHDLGIGTDQEKIIEVLERKQFQMQPWGFNLDFDALTS